MKLISWLLPLIATFGFTAAQTNIQVDPTVLQALLNALDAAGLPSLGQVIKFLNGTADGVKLISSLLTTANTVVFPEDASTLLNLLAEPSSLLPLIEYHTFQGTLNHSTVAASPNHTIARSHLADPSTVHLENGLAQAAVFTVDNGALRVLNQPTVSNLTEKFAFQEFSLLIADKALAVPGNLTAVIAQYNLTSFGASLNSAGLTAPFLGENGITIFAPSDSAIPSTNDLKNLNGTIIAQAVGNYVIQNVTIYTSTFTSGTYISTSGSPLEFSNDGSSWTIKFGKTSAKIIQSDVLLDNGVVHIIDNVLAKATASASSSDAESLKMHGLGALSLMLGAFITALLF